MKNSENARFLVLENSGRPGGVALARGRQVVRQRSLDETRRHARDLAPAVAELLAAEGWKPFELAGVIVSQGPGSYTGLRVGVMAAKAFAYATGIALVGVDTFAVVALQAGGPATALDVLADAQQDNVYVQSFVRSAGGNGWQPAGPLTIRLFPAWLEDRSNAAAVTGPGLHRFAGRFPAGTALLPGDEWDPRPESLLDVGVARWEKNERDSPWTLEPLYLRPSSAEEKWAGKEIPPVERASPAGRSGPAGEGTPPG